MAESKILGATRIHNLLNFNKLKLYTDLFRAENWRLYGGALKFRGSIRFVTELPSSASEGDIVSFEGKAYEYKDGAWVEKELAAGDVYVINRSESDSYELGPQQDIYKFDGEELKPFGHNDKAFDFKYDCNAYSDGYQLIMTCDSPVMLLVEFTSNNEHWHDLVMFDPNTGDLKSIAHDYFAAYKIRSSDTYKLGLSEFFPGYPQKTKALKVFGSYKFMVLSYAAEPYSIQWYTSNRITGFSTRTQCEPYIKSEYIDMSGAFQFTVGDSEVLSLQDNYKFIGGVNEEFQEYPVITLGRFYENQMYNFEFSGDLPGIIFRSSLSGEDLLIVDEPVRAGDILTLTPNKASDSETVDWQYSKLAAEFTSSDGSIIITKERGVTDFKAVKQPEPKPYINVVIDQIPMENDNVIVESSGDDEEYAGNTWKKIKIRLKNGSKPYNIVLDGARYKITQITGSNGGQRIAICGHIIPAFEYHYNQYECAINFDKDENGNIVRTTNAGQDNFTRIDMHTYPLERSYSEYIQWYGQWWGNGYCDAKTVNYIDESEYLPVSSRGIFNKHYINRIETTNGNAVADSRGNGDNSFFFYSGDGSVTIKGESYNLDFRVNNTAIVYKYNGSVDNFEDLPTRNVNSGDVYNVVNAYETYPANTNFAAIVEDDVITWDSLGGMISYPVKDVKDTAGNSLVNSEGVAVIPGSSGPEKYVEYVKLEDTDGLSYANTSTGLSYSIKKNPTIRVKASGSSQEQSERILNNNYTIIRYEGKPIDVVNSLVAKNYEAAVPVSLLKSYVEAKTAASVTKGVFDITSDNSSEYLVDILDRTSEKSWGSIPRALVIDPELYDTVWISDEAIDSDDFICRLVPASGKEFPDGYRLTVIGKYNIHDRGGLPVTISDKYSVGYYSYIKNTYSLYETQSQTDRNSVEFLYYKGHWYMK